MVINIDKYKLQQVIFNIICNIGKSHNLKSIIHTVHYNVVMLKSSAALVFHFEF